MLGSQTEELADGRSVRYAIFDGASPVSFADAIHGWQRDPEFRDFFIGLLKWAPFPVFRWETPPVTVANADRPFEFVLLDSPEIALYPDPGAFAGHFDGIEPGAVVEFANLGHDATLVVPGPDEAGSDFGHLASFMRNSRASQQHRLWEAVGAAMQRRIGSKPVWLSTAGGGVAWLHVRLDDRPKYYGYAPYRHTG